MRPRALLTMFVTGILSIACDQQLAGPEGEGGVAVRIVFPRTDGSAPALAAEAVGESGEGIRGERDPWETLRLPDEAVQGSSDGPARLAAAVAAPSPAAARSAAAIHVAQVLVQLFQDGTPLGQPTSLQPNSDSTQWTGSLRGVPVGGYVILAEILDAQGGLLYSGQSNVTVTEGDNSSANIAVAPLFVSQPAQPLPAMIDSASLAVSWGSITSADGYELKWTTAGEAACAQASTGSGALPATQSSYTITFTSAGTWTICMRASVTRSPAIRGNAEGAWSELGTVLIEATATAIAAASQTTLSGTVGAAVAPSPSVVVSDQFDHPMGGATVEWVVMAGGGSVENGSVATGSDGIASVTWTLGTAASVENVLRATVAGVADLADVRFTANAVAGPGHTLRVETEPSSTAAAGVPFAAQPAVQLYDSLGNAKAQAGYPVTAAVATGGGTLVGQVTRQTGDDGLAVFTNLTIAGVIGDRTLVFTSPGMAPDTSATVTIIPGATAALALAGLPGTTTAGVAVDARVTAVDAWSNTTPDYTGTVEFTSSDTQAELTDTTYAFVVGDAGTHAFPGGVILKTAGTQTLQVQDANNTGVSPSAVVATTVEPAEPAEVQITGGDGQSAEVGTAVPAAPSVQVLDPFGNGVPGAQVTFSIAAGGGVVTDSIVATDAGGVATVGSWEVGTATGTNELAAAVAGLTPVTFTATAVAGATRAFDVTGIATPATAGTPSDLTVTARDRYGNLTDAYTGTVTFSSSDLQADLPPNTAFGAGDGGVITLSGGVTLKTAGTHSVTVADASDGAVSGSLMGIVVDPATTSVLELSGIQTIVAAGTATDVTVTARDAYGNTTPSYDAVIDFTSSDVQATLPHLVDFTPDSAGIATITAGIVLRTAGSQSVTVYDTTVAAGLADSVVGIAVLPSGAAGLRFRALPSPYEAGTLRTLEITAVDSLGNRVQTYEGTIRLSSSDPGATFDATEHTFQAADLGRISTPEVTLTTAGTQTVSAVDISDATVNGSVQAQVVGSDAAALEVTGFPSNATAGGSGSVTVTARDQYGNVATSYLGTVQFTAPSDPRATLPADYAFSELDEGIRVFQNAVILVTTGTQSVAVTDAVNAGITGSQSGITVTAAAVDHFTVVPDGFTPGSDNVAGAPLGIAVTALDTYENVVTNYAGTVTFASSDTSDQQVMPAVYTYASGDNGVHPFQATLVTVGTQSITVQDQASAAVSGVLPGITIVHAAVAQLALDVADTLAAGIAGDIVVTALDAFGNLVSTGALGPLTFATDDPSGSASVPADYTMTAGDAGSYAAVGGVTLVTAPAQPVRATLTNSGATAEVLVAVLPGDATTLAFTVQPPDGQPSAVLSPAVEVTARDAFGNVATGFTGQVTLAFTAGTNEEAAGVTGTSATAVSGVASFPSVVVSTSGLFQLDASALAGTLTVTSTEFSILDPGALQLVFVDQPVNGLAGGDLGSIAVEVRDLVGNVITDVSGDVTLSIVAGTGGTGAELLGTPTVALANGVATWNPGDVSIEVAGAAYQFRAQAPNVLDGSNNPALVSSVTSATFNVTPATAATFEIAGITDPVPAGTASSMTVTALDPYGNVDTAFAGLVDFTSSDTWPATLPAQYTFQDADDGAHTFLGGVTLYSVGEHSVTATSGAVTGTQSAITVTPAAADTLQFTVQPGAGVANEVLSPAPRVTAYDAYGNVTTGFTGTVAVDFTSGTNTEGASLSGATAQAVAGVATFGTLSVSLAGDFGLTASSGALGVAESNQFAIAPQQASRLVFVTSPVSGAAGASRTATVQLQDGGGTLITDHTGTVNLAIVEGTGSNGAVLLGTLSQPLVTGEASFTDLVIQLAGAGYQLVASSSDVEDPGANPLDVSSGLSATFDVRPGVMDALVVEGHASPTTAGVPSSLVVTAEDEYGNVDTSYAGEVQFSATDAGAGLPANYTFTSGDRGVHVFLDGITLYTVGDQSVTATDVGNGVFGTQSGITVQPAAAATLVVYGITDPIGAGVNSDVTVEALDAYANRATGYRGTIGFTATASGSVPPDYTFIAGDAGIHTFASGVRLDEAGEHSVTATDLAQGSITGTQGAITVLSASVAELVVTGIGDPVVAGVQQSVTVEARDGLGNAVTDYAGTVTFSSSDPSAILPTAYTFVPSSDLGAHTFTSAVELRTAGERSVTATDGSVSGSQIGITVQPADANTLIVTGVPDPIIAGTAASVTVEALDPYGNRATGYVGTVHIETSDPQQTAPAGHTFAGGDAGLYTFTNGIILRTAGDRTVTATDSSAGITGQQTAVTVQPADASALFVGVSSDPVVANVASSISVVARDPYDNQATGYRGTIAFTTTDPNGAHVVPAPYTFTSGDAGSHSFTNGLRLVTAGEQTLTATDVATGSITGNRSSITVTPTAPQSVTVTPTAALVTVPFQETQFGVTAIADTFGNLITTTDITWVSDYPPVGWVIDGTGADGTIRADEPGTAHFIPTVAYGGGTASGSATLTVDFFDFANPSTATYYNDLWSADGVRIWAVGDTVVRYSTDGFASTTLASGGVHNNNGVWGPHPDTAFVVADNGVIRRFIAGQGYLTLTNAVSRNLNGISGVAEDGDTRWANIAVGDSGKIVHILRNSVPDGNVPVAFLDYQVAGAPNLNAVWVRKGLSQTPNEITAVAVGDNGTLLHRRAYYTGSTWSQVWEVQSTPTTCDLRAVWGTSASDIWAVGDEDTVLHFNGSYWVLVSGDDCSGSPTSIIEHEAVWGYGGEVFVAGCVEYVGGGCHRTIVRRWNGGAFITVRDAYEGLKTYDIWMGAGDMWLATPQGVVRGRRYW